MAERDELMDRLTGKTTKPKMSEEEITKIVEGVFLHGRDTSDLSFGLPDGQYTILKAISLLSGKKEKKILSIGDENEKT